MHKGRNKELMSKIWKTYFLFFLLLTAVSCSVIDEDQSDCGEQAQVNYELRIGQFLEAASGRYLY